MATKKKENPIDSAKKLLEAEMLERREKFIAALDKLKKEHRCEIAIVVPFKDSYIPIEAVMRLPVAIDIVPKP